MRFLLYALLLALAACAPRYHGPVTDHFNGKRFYNPDTVNVAKRQGGLFKWLLHRQRGPWLAQPNAQPGPKAADRILGDSVVLTFVGHSTFLLQTGGLNILTDPVWSNFVGLNRVLSVKRQRPPGLRFEDLPKIDVVLLSHAHYDHLDLPTLRRLVKAHNPTFVVPLGVGYLPKRIGGRVLRELDWNDTLHVARGLKLTCVPARHFSNRGMGDRDRTLWGGYLLHTGYGTIYFAGDTGYGPHFSRIAETAQRSETGKIKLAMLPIGSYRPEWFMAPVHTSPADAVRAFQDIARVSNQPLQAVGIHFGAFQQGDDGLWEPALDLTEALRKAGVSYQAFTAPTEGRAMIYK